MKLLIMGSTGETGEELVKQALESGHTVTAFARNPVDVKINNERLTVLQGDVLDSSSVKKAVKGQDAVLSALGIRILKKNTIISDGTGNIIRAMEKCGVIRFVCMSSIGVGDSKSQQRQLGPLYNLIMIPVMLRNMFQDKEVQETYIMESSLDWTIVRPPVLTSGARTGLCRGLGSDDPSIRAKISRADVADFMLKQLSDNMNINKAVSLSY